MPSMLQVRLLGEFSLTYDDRSVTGSIAGRSQALLAYLILHRHAPQLRQRLAFQLWTDSTDTQARTNLRKTLSQLRHTLPQADQLLVIDAKTLQWQPSLPFTLDVIQFEDAVRSAQMAESTLAPDVVRSALEQAVEVYRGELLPGCEDEWIVPERERLQQMYLRAVEQLVDLLETQQDYRTALDYAQRLLRLDALNEGTYCTLMRLYRLNGDRANALQVYHRCMTVLREELGIDPSATTRQMYEHLLKEDDISNFQTQSQSGSQSSSRSGSRSSTLRSAHPSPIRLTRSAILPLVGRDREWQEIQQWASSILVNSANLMEQEKQPIADGVTNRVLLLVGEPGIGKTRLLEELCALTQANSRQAQQGQVLWGRGFAAEMVRPYGIWIDALRSSVIPSTVNVPAELSFLLPEMLPEGERVNALPDRGHLFDAVVQLLSQWAQQIPIFVILDDIQWIDEASSALLNYAIRLLSHLPIRFACTGRSRELEANGAILRVLQSLRREQRLHTLQVQPFDRAQTVELLRSIPTVHSSQQLSIELVDRVFVDSGGNPLFALEVARALLQDETTQAETLESLIHDRLQQLDEAAREFLPWAAALGRSFKPTTVAQIANYPLPKLLMAIEQLERQGIIRPSAAIGSKPGQAELGYDFAHDIVRQAVYRQLSEPRRCLVHLQIAHQLHQRFTQSSFQDSDLVGDIAHHASLGGDHELAASTALAAAEQCLKLFAYAEAGDLAQQGIQHCQSLDDRTRIRLHLRLLWVRAIAGVTGDRATQLENDVQQLIQEAVRLGLKEEEAIGLETLMMLNASQSNFIGLHEHSLRAAEISRVASPATAARLLAYSGSCLAEMGQEMNRAEALLLEAESLAARVGLESIDLVCGLGCVYAYRADYAEAQTRLQQALRMAQAEQDHWRECYILSYLAMLELEFGHPIAALPYCNEIAIVAAKIQGEGSEGAIATALAALANYQLQPLEANTKLEQAITLLYQVDAKRMLSYVLSGAAEVDLTHQRLELASTRAEAALQSAQIIDQPCEIAFAGAILIQTALALGESDRAAVQVQALQTEIDRHDLSKRARTAIDRAVEQFKLVASSHLEISSK
jgi:DNA-binding SARP family transcriptional activator